MNPEDSNLIPLCTFFVAGVNYRMVDFRQTTPADKVTLIPEPTNQYDAYAIRIELGSRHIGYVPRTEQTLLHDLLREQILVHFELNKHDLSRDCKPYEACSIKVWAERRPAITSATTFNVIK